MIQQNLIFWDLDNGKWKKISGKKKSNYEWVEERVIKIIIWSYVNYKIPKNKKNISQENIYIMMYWNKLRRIRNYIFNRIKQYK